MAPAIKWETLSDTCPHRSVSDDGRIVCKMIFGGDNEITPWLCHECPISHTDCEHLRFTLKKIASEPITVRYVTGRVEVLNDGPARVVFLRAACARKVLPIGSPLECVNCGLYAAQHARPSERNARQTEAWPVPQAALVS